MRLKDSTVSIKGISTEIAFAANIVDQVMKEKGQEAVVTSGTEETTRHGRTSLHYDGNALDLRSRSFEDTELILAFCKEALGHNPDIDMILENKGEYNEHFHLEFQPKRRDNLL